MILLTSTTAATTFLTFGSCSSTTPRGCSGSASGAPTSSCRFMTRLVKKTGRRPTSHFPLAVVFLSTVLMGFHGLCPRVDA